MESLVAYGSDDDCDEIIQPKSLQSSSQVDANYEEVQMDLSEESNDSTKPVVHRQSYDHLHSKSRDSRSDRRDIEKDKYKKSSEDYKYKYEHGHSSPKKEDKYKDKYKNDEKEKGERSREYKRDQSRDNKSKYRDDRNRDDRNRDDRNRDDRNRDDRNRDDRNRDDRNRESRKSREEQDKYKEYHEASRDDRRTYRASSRDRHRSRSPRRTEYKRRSSSRDRNRSGYSKRYERTNNKMDRLEKLGIEIGSANSNYAGTSSQLNDKDQNRDRFYMPGITGRFTEQIQQRKLLWQKKNPKVEPVQGLPPIQPGGKVWQNTTFAQDTDGKVANKFKRLMGIKVNQPELNKPVNDTLKKQEEMFSSMEAQYEVARTATHTMRGVGLGFGSFQR